MNELMSTKKTMTSREIAELTGKQHAHVMEAIRNMEAAWVKVNGSNFRLVEYRDAKGEMRPEYKLSKTECLYVATKFNDEARARLIIRWEELERQNVLDFSNPDTVLMLAQNWKMAEEEKKRLQVTAELQAKELQQAAPKVEYFNDVLQSESLIPTTIIAKELGMSAETLNEKLKRLGVQYKLNGTWVLYHKHQNSGFTGTKTHTYKDSTGKERTSVHTYWTERGREFIHRVIKNQLQLA